jgi:hypothetical protein
MVLFESKPGENKPSRVVMNYAAFFASLTTIAGALVGMLIFLFSIKTDMEVIKSQHERRISNLEFEYKDIKDRQWDFNTRIKSNENKIEDYLQHNQ